MPSLENLDLFQLYLVFVGMVAIFFILWIVPKWQARNLTDLKDYLTLKNAIRQTLAQILGGAFILAGLYFTAETLLTAREGQITERYTKAIDHLGEHGEGKWAMRLGGIYALERIARDSEKDHWPIMEILTTYVRYNAAWNHLSEENKSQNDFAPPPDIQAIMTVLGRRTRTYQQGEDHSLELMLTNLRNAKLINAHLEGAILAWAHLEGANLLGAHLNGANLLGAHLERAYFEGTDLKGASLKDAYLEGARELTVEQLSTVYTLYGAHLDPPLLAQIQQQYPHLLEKPRD
jgi:hypothetical protein